MKVFYFLVLSASAQEELTEIKQEREKLSRAQTNGTHGFAARSGTSLCSLRSPSKPDQCCEGINLECFGCNPVLLSDGQKCVDQTTNSAFEQRRDCFCDSSCILYEDCCSDHIVTCAHLYSTEPLTSTTTTTTSTTTTTRIETTVRPSESWIFIELFARLRNLINIKYNGSPKGKFKGVVDKK